MFSFVSRRGGHVVPESALEAHVCLRFQKQVSCPGSSEGAVSTSAAAVRATRLLRGYTRRMLGGRSTPPLAAPHHM